MSTFYQQWYKSAQSGSTVKLIRFGKVFADVSPDAYTGSWNATLSQYEFTLDTSTFIDATTYRIEDGSGNVVVKDFVVHPPIFDETAIPDNFVKNDADDSIIGELTIKPASGTDSQLRVGDEDGDSIRITSENAAKSTARILEIKAISIGLMAQDGATAIKITNLANGTSANDAVNKSQLTSITGGSAVTISAIDTRVTALEGGSGTFSAPDVALTGNETEGGIGLNWAMNSAPNESAVLRYEVYVGSTALAGYSAGVVNSTIFDNIKDNYRRLNLATPRDRSAFIPANRPLWVIVVAFDHTATPVMEGSANLQFTPDNGIDSSVDLIGGARDIVTGLTVLAGEVANLKTNSGSGFGELVMFSDNSAAAAASGSAAAALVEYAETSGGYTVKRRTTVVKNSVYKKFRLRCQAKATVAGQGIQIDCSSLTANLIVSNAAYEDKTLDIDLSTLADGTYELTVSTKATASTITVTKMIGSMVSA